MQRIAALPLLVALALIGVFGAAWAQEPDLTFHTPQFVLDDADFDYYARDGAWINFWRDTRANAVHVTLSRNISPGAVRFHYDRSRLPRAGTVPHENLHVYAGLDVSVRSIEIPYFAESHTMSELAREYGALLPELGFHPDAEMFAGGQYVYTCGCDAFERTGIRMILTHVGDMIFVRLTQYMPSSYSTLN